MKNAPALVLLLGFWAFTAAGPLRADEPPLPLGDEILIPDVTAGDQSAPEVSSSYEGDFVAVWQSSGADGDGFGILAQLFALDGNEVGFPFPINSTVAGDQTRPAVGADDSGDFAVAWQSPDGDGTGIFARRYDESGVPDTAELPVNTTTAGAQSRPSVAAAENRNFLVVWQGPDGSSDGIWARLFDRHGVALTGELLINTTTTGSQTNPQVRAFDETDGYFVVWEGPDANGTGIYLRQVSSVGVPLGSEAPVNDVVAGNQRNAAVAVSGIDNDQLDRNIFVVAWQSPDSAGNGIWARVFDDNLTPIGPAQLVNDDDLNDQTEPAVAIDNGEDSDGINFVVTWTEAPILGRGSPIFIRGRRLGGLPPARGGNRGAATAEFAVSVNGGTTAASAVATEDNGDFVAIWQSLGQDGSGEGVYGRRFAGQPIFVDGFESGDSSRWSATVP